MSPGYLIIVHEKHTVLVRKVNLFNVTCNQIKLPKNILEYTFKVLKSAWIKLKNKSNCNQNNLILFVLAFFQQDWPHILYFIHSDYFKTVA